MPSVSRTGQGGSPDTPRSKLIARHALLVVLIVAVGAAVVLSVKPEWITGRSATASHSTILIQPVANVSGSTVQHHADLELEPKTLYELLDISTDELGSVDIARMNLLCAVGLPGAEDIDIDKMLATIDRWAERVKFETERHLYRLTDPRFKDHAEHYQHSEARFRAEWLVNVLQQDIGVHYHKGFVPSDQKVPLFKTSKETFIHGLMDHEDAHQAFGGNCVSLPLIYAAVGRRLGYPIKLVNSNEHVFCRWMGNDHPNPAWRDQLNFDGAGEGFSIDPDSFYLSWPRPSSRAAVEVYDWLKPLTPSQELALFLLARGHVFRHVSDDQANAQIAYAHALQLWPTNRNPLVFLTGTVEAHWRQEFAAHPHVYPQQQVRVDTRDDALRPWWETPRGRAANAAQVRQIEEQNRRQMEQYRQAHGVPQPSPSATWPVNPQTSTYPSLDPYNTAPQP